MALKGKIYSIAKQYDDLNTNNIFKSMMIESTDKETIVMDGRNLAAGSIFAEQIHAGAITADHIKSGTITADHLNIGSVDADELWAKVLILPGKNYGGVVINNDGISMKSTGLDVTLSSSSGFNITDKHDNPLIDIDPSTGNVKMQVNQMSIGGYSAATAKDIDDIEVGVSNHLRNTGVGNSESILMFGHPMLGPSFSLSAGAEYYTLESKVSSGEAYYRALSQGTIPSELSGTWTFSGKVLIPEGTSGVPLTRTQIAITSPSGWVNSYGNGERPINATKGIWTKFIHTFEIPKGTQSLHLGIKFANNTQEVGDKIHFKNFKLERGNIATDWTPAPEDVQAEIDSRPTFQDFDQTDKVTINGGNIKAGTISSENNYSRINLDDGTFSFGNGRLVWNGSDMTVNGKISVTNIDGAIPKSKLDSSVQADLTAGATAEANAKKYAELKDSVTNMSGNSKKFTNTASFDPGGSSYTGYLIIRTPITSTFMTKLKISGYNYRGGSSNLDLDVGFYAYTGSSFMNYDFVSRGSFPISQVRLGRDSAGGAVVILGTSSTTYSYPKISVDEAIIGHGTPPDSYRNGWSISISNSLSGISNIVSISGVDTQSNLSDTKGKTDAWSYNGTTEIDGKSIKTGTLSANQITTGILKSQNDNSWLNLNNGEFNFANGGLVYSGGNLTLNGKLSVTNLDGDIPKDKLESSVRTEIDAGTAAKTKTDKWTHPGTTLIGGDFIETRTMTADRIKARSITANEIKAKSITTEELSVTSLSAITANLGTVTAGIIRSEDNAINIDLDTGTINLSRPLTINSLPVSTKKEVEDAVQSIEVGGRNLWLKSSAKDSFDGWNVGSGTKTLNSTVLLNDEQTIKFVKTSDSSGGMWRVVATKLEANTVFTYSFMVKSSVSVPVHNGSLAHMQVIGTSNGGNVHREQNMKYYPNSVPANKWTKVSVTFNTPVEAVAGETFTLRSYLWFLPNNAELYFGEFKFEKGNKVTDWTPAPEDTDKRLDEVEGNINNAVTTIDNTGVTVKDGSFFLEDDTSDTKYSLQVKRNMIDYHSFETVHAFPPEYNDLTSSTVNPDNTSNTSIGGSWNRVGSPRITRGGATYQNEKVGIFGKSIVANNSNYIFLMLSSSQAELFPGERLTFSFHSKAPILGTGGIPRVEVHMVRANNTVVTTIGTKNYPASTKAIKRHSFSFTIPSNFDDNSHLLRIRVLSSNSNEVVIDGTQLVEGNHPVQYDLATEAWNLREELGMNSQNLRGDINYRGISPGLIHTNQISVPNNSDSRVINFMQSDGISTHMWVDEAVVRRSLDVYGNINISENPIIDSGHNTNGEWMKFYDGTMICRGYRVKTMALNSTWGSMYWGNIGVMTYPQEFSATPYVVYTNSSESAVFYTTSANRSTSQTGNVDIYRPVSTVSQRWEIGYIAIGRWKW